MKRKLAAALAACLMLIGLCSCQEKSEPQSGIDSSIPSPENHWGTQENKEDQLVLDRENPLQFHELPGEHRFLKSGELVYTLKDARIITNINDLKEPDRIYPYEMDVYEYDEKGNPIASYSYPDCIEEDGELKLGGMLLVVDFSVESRDAEAWKLEQDGLLFLHGKYEDPHIFRADHPFYMIDFSDPHYDTPNTSVICFNKADECTESWCAYRLNPGETADLQIGYLLNSHGDGSDIDLSRVCLVWSQGENGFEYINLQLEEPNHNLP